jgi:ferredoxin
MNTRKLVVDVQKCAGAGICLGVAPASFEIGEDLMTVAVNPPGDQEEAILRAIDQCPMQAIFFVNEPGRR